MSDYTPTDGRAEPAEAPQHVAIQDLRRVAESCRDLGDPELMAQAWGCADLASQALTTESPAEVPAQERN